MKPSDTCWLALKHCVKAVRANYSSIVLALENMYETSHEPEDFGLGNALSSHSTVAAMYPIDYSLTEVAKLSCALQTKYLDLSLISSLEDATLYIYKMQEKSYKQQQVLNHSFRYMLFSERVGKPYIRLIKDIQLV